MKILGKADREYRSYFIVEMEADELAMLVSTTKYADGRDMSQLRVGDKVAVDKSYHRLRQLLANNSTVRKNIDSLRALADLMEPLEDCVEVAIPEKQAEPIL